jgi:hypothetical protein
MVEQFQVEMGDLSPRVYYRITDNWLELSLRFIVDDHSSREVKDVVSRHILTAFDEAKIGIASSTIEVVSFPKIRTEVSGER